MTKSKEKGTRAETMVVKFLRDGERPGVERRALAGTKDKGDIAGIPGVCIEVKAEENPPHRPDRWFEELRKEMKNAGAIFGLLVVKVKYKPVERWDAWMPIDQLLPGQNLPTMSEEWSWVRMDLLLAERVLAERGF